MSHLLLVILLSGSSSIGAEEAEASPWLLADQALAIGDAELARATAEGAAGQSGDALRRYVARPPSIPRHVREKYEDLKSAPRKQARLRRLLDVCRALRKQPSILRACALLERAHLLLVLERVQESSTVLGECTRVAKTLGWTEFEEVALSLRFQALAGLYDYEAMLATAQRLTELHRAGGRDLRAAMTQADVGSLLATLGRYEPARRHLEEAELAFTTPSMRDLRAQVLASLALVDLRAGRLAAGLGHVEEALSLAPPESDAQAYALAALGALQERLGECSEAEESYGRALGTLTPESVMERGDLFGNLGQLYLRQGRSEESIEQFEAALEVYEKLGDARAAGSAHRSLGDVAVASGRFDDAVRDYRKALRHHEEWPPERTQTLVALADALQQAGRADEAAEAIQKARDDEPHVAYQDTRIRLWSTAARVELAAGRPLQAIAHARHALRLANEALTGLADHEAAAGRKELAAAVRVGLQAAFSRGITGAVIEFVERGRAGALLESLGGRDALQGVGLTEELASLEATARTGVTSAQLRYQAARADGLHAESRATRADLESARIAFRTAMAKLQRKAKRVASVTYPEPSTLRQLRATLADHEVLVLYVLLPEQAHAVVVSKHKTSMVELGESAVVRAACGVVRTQIEESWTDEKAFTSAIARLEDLLIAPLDLPATARLLVSPDGPLALIPWPMVVGEREVSCVPSGSTWRLLASDGAREGGRVLAVGDPTYAVEQDGRLLRVYHSGHALTALPETRHEIEVVAGPGGVVLSGEAATEAAFERALALEMHWASVHLACHGLVNEHAPSLSALALTPADGDDGFLTALEVFGMRIPADLVVLSACESGRGRLMEGEGLVGLARGFMVAGTPRVIASLWPVDDAATRALMVRFYELWGEGMTTSSALRQAQLDLSRREGWEHPKYWGAWILWGLPD